MKHTFRVLIVLSAALLTGSLQSCKGEEYVAPPIIGGAGQDTGEVVREGDEVAIVPMKKRTESISKVVTGYRSITVRSKKLTTTTSIMVAGDTHLTLVDERQRDWAANYKRMAGAYNSMEHWESGLKINQKIGFEEFVDDAVEKNVQAMFHMGDLLSFPSSYGVEVTMNKVKASGIPFYYTCGNHDFHMEGLPGTQKALRAEWIPKVLLPLYPKGVDPLAYSVQVGEINFVMLDNSIFEVTPAQLNFVREEIKKGLPTVIMSHIPLYCEAHGENSGWGCGSPYWDAAHDTKLYITEGRLQWPVEGHTKCTYSYYNEVVSADNVIAYVAGHVHGLHVDEINGMPMITLKANYSAAHYQMIFEPLPDKPEKEEGVVQISDCDEITGWSGSPNITVDEADRREGTGCLVGSNEKVNIFSKTFTTPIDTKADLSGKYSLKFWLYVEDASVINNAGRKYGQIELTSGGKYDIEEIKWIWEPIVLKDGWNELSLPLKLGDDTKGFGSLRAGQPEPDLSRINFFRIFHQGISREWNEGQGNSIKRIKIKLDDIRVVENT